MKQPFPGTITSIEEQARTRKHLGTRVNVFINDRFSFAIDAQIVKRYALEPGVVLDMERLAEIIEEDGDAKAYAKAIYFLGFRIRSAGEIRERLRRAEWPDAVIERVIERLHKEKLLDDATFAATWVEHRTLIKPRGSRALRQELRFKGVNKEEIEAALPNSNEELENAVVALRSKERQWERLEGRERQQKMIEWLQRRGFPFGTARNAVTQFDEENSA
jgi:regulatory protein